MLTRLIFILGLGAVLSACSAAQSDVSDTPPEEKPKAESTYNAALAEKLRADDYGMGSYVFVTLNTGPNDATITDEAERGELFRGHFANMERLATDGKLVLAGPFMDAPPKRGLYIFDVTMVEDAKALVETDPAVAAGIFTADYAKYYGSAALRQINEVHGTIQKSAIE